MKSNELIYFLIAAFVIHVPIYSQSQLGADIKGETFKDQFGTAMALSEDGSILAVAATENDEIASNSGHVRLYKRENAKWIQLGTDIDGFGSSDRLGTSVALSSNGLIVACGAPENGSPKGYVVIREWDGNEWVPKGEVIGGIGVGDRFGTAVALSSDGNRIAVGAIGNDDVASNAGQVRVYDWNGDSWVQIGQPINGEAAGDDAGSAVSLSADGNRLAIGTPDNSERDDNAGQVRVFEWDGISAWNQIGADIFGQASGDKSGSKVELSSDGNRLAIGSPFNDNNGTWSGNVRIYEWQENDWIQLGEDLNGEKSPDRSGWSIDMGDNGNRIIIGALNNGGNGTQAGHARIYEWSNEKWNQIGVDIDGDMAQDLLGYSVAMSENGQRVAVGAPINGNAFDNNAGYARVFTLDNYLDTTSKWQTVSGDLLDNWYSVAQMEIVGDTLIDQNNYLRILKTSNILTLDATNQDTIDYQALIQEELYLREEDKKFYSWNTLISNPQDELIVDFDLEIGDEIGTSPIDTIESIDSLLIGQEFRKIFYTTLGRRIYEGIGTNQGLFEGLTLLGDESFSILHCYSQNNENYLLHDGALPEVIDIPSCDGSIVTSTQSFEEQKAIKVYPNPTENVLYIDLKALPRQSFTIEVRDLNGFIFLQKETTSNNLLQLDISNLPAGFALLTIRGKSFNQFVKFIKL